MYDNLGGTSAVDSIDSSELVELAEDGGETGAEINDDYGDWQRAHEELSKLAHRRAGLDWEEGQCFLRALRAGTHSRLGYGSFRDYAEHLFGYTPRHIQDRLRVAEALEELPELSEALREGILNWSAVRELTRVAVPNTEGEWLKVARNRTAREVERVVSGRRPGDRPKDKPDAAARRHVLRFEVSAQTIALFREALAKLRREAGHSLDDDAALLLLARQTLGGPKDEGRSSYQIKLDVCTHCRRAELEGGGELVEVSSEVVEMAECDAQHIRPIGAATHTGEEPTHAETHTGTTASAKTRATQTIPPAIRRLVMRRDHGRCVVPGCRHTVWLDLHHLDPRAEGGTHDPERMGCFCGAHHDAVHAGKLIVEGRASSGFTFHHADGTRYGGAVSAKAAEVCTTTFQALKHMGFRESDTRHAVEKASAHMGDATFEMLLRRALVELAPAGSG
jgi:hypothetical protein